MAIPSCGVCFQQRLPCVMLQRREPSPSVEGRAVPSLVLVPHLSAAHTRLPVCRSRCAFVLLPPGDLHTKVHTTHQLRLRPSTSPSCRLSLSAAAAMAENTLGRHWDPVHLERSYLVHRSSPARLYPAARCLRLVVKSRKRSYSGVGTGRRRP